MTTILITGADGFVGRHLATEAKKRNFKVIGISKRNPNLDTFDDYIEQDLTEEIKVLPEADAVVHLAGLAAVGPSFDNPQFYIETNSRITTNLGEALLKTNQRPKLITVSSGAVYKSKTTPITEQDPVNPSSPYVVSKLLVENQTKYYNNRGIPAVIARPFNHIGPGQQAGFIIPDFYEKLKANPTHIEVGNLDSLRDYTDVRDVANAYLDLATSDATGIFNICSHQPHSGQEILELLCKTMNLDLPKTNEVTQRAIDPSSITGDNSKLIETTGWQPQFTIEQSINDFVTTQN